METLIEKLDDRIGENNGAISADYSLGYDHGIKDAIQIVKEHSPWISVKNPPDTDRSVLIMDSIGNNIVGYFWDGNVWNVYNDEGLIYAKYWMDIPKLPKQ